MPRATRSTVLLVVIIMSSLFVPHVLQAPHVSHIAFSEDKSTIESRVADLEAEIGGLKAEDENYDFLREETKNQRTTMQNELKEYREFVQKEREGFLDSINAFLLLASVIGGGVGAFIIWTFHSSRRDLQNEYKEQLTKARESAEAEFRNLMKQDIDSFEERVTALERIVDRELSYKNTRVLLIGSSSEIENMKSRELTVIKKGGIKHIKSMIVEDYSEKETFSEAVNDKLQNEEVDIIIYLLQVGEENTPEDRLQAVVELLTTGEYEIPLVIYVSDYYQGMKEVLKKYPWTLYANHPATLVGHLFTLVHAFNRKSVNRER